MNKLNKLKVTKKTLTGVSLFSSIGIGETYLQKCGVNIKVANELVDKRASLYQAMHPETKMIAGDITNPIIFNRLILESPKKIDFLLATPPCQGVSIAGKNRCPANMPTDKRNYLLFSIIEFIIIKRPTFVLIENVPQYMNLSLPYKGEMLSIFEILTRELAKNYLIDHKVLDCSHYGVAQKRKRLIIKIHKKNTVWEWPTPDLTNIKTVRDTIGHLPSLESNQKSDIPWHFSRKHINTHITWMKYTPTGQSAFSNKIHFPKKADGTKISGYESTYRRILWDEPAPTITMRNDAISSQRNVHPGNLKSDGTYSDARALTPLELMLINSLPDNWKIPPDTQETLVRQCLGESVPPLLIQKIVESIDK